MLSQEDLVRHNITTPIVQRRLLDEIFGLKLQVARGKLPRKIIYNRKVNAKIHSIAPGEDEYRFDMLKKVISYTSSDELDKLRCMCYVCGPT